MGFKEEIYSGNGFPLIAAIQTFGDRINLHVLCGAPHNTCHVKRCVM
jgi:hypothetical protein